jgi:hypothetical protein
MTMDEAFDELLPAACERGLEGELQNLAAVMGHPSLTKDPRLVPADVKAVIGALFDYGRKVELSPDASRTFRTGLARVYGGKPADGVADRVLDADISTNLDLI